MPLSFSGSPILLQNSWTWDLNGASTSWVGSGPQETQCVLLCSWKLANMFAFKPVFLNLCASLCKVLSLTIIPRQETIKTQRSVHSHPSWVKEKGGTYLGPFRWVTIWNSILNYVHSNVQKSIHTPKRSNGAGPTKFANKGVSVIFSFDSQSLSAYKRILGTNFSFWKGNFRLSNGSFQNSTLRV